MRVPGSDGVAMQIFSPRMTACVVPLPPAQYLLNKTHDDHKSVDTHQKN